MCKKHCDCKYKVKVENVNDGFGIYGSGSHSEAISAKWSADMIIADNIEHEWETESLRKKLIKIGCNKTSKQLYIFVEALSNAIQCNSGYQCPVERICAC